MSCQRENVARVAVSLGNVKSRRSDAPRGTFVREVGYCRDAAREGRRNLGPEHPAELSG